VTLTGHCHCGAVRVTLETARPASDLPLRACQCGFCGTRGALTTADPHGRMSVGAAPGAIRRYRFGLKITDFLLCAACGTYVAAVGEMDGRTLGVVNVLGTGLPGFEGRTPDPMNYDGEDVGGRQARREGRWMPAAVVETRVSA
jgi:hypothetical protein